MQVLCMVTSEEDCDVHCPCCAQRYRVYFARMNREEQAVALHEVRAALASHHGENALPSAHPHECFTVPEWLGPLHTCAAALLSGAPIRPPAKSKPGTLSLVPSAQQRLVS
jgi:hypothetical protein